MTCFCLCHNNFAIEQGKAPHVASQCDCQKETSPTVRAQVDVCYTIEEQLKQKAKLEDVMRLIAMQEEHTTEANETPLVTLQHVVQWAKEACVVTILCRACRALTQSFPCVHCGNAVA